MDGPYLSWQQNSFVSKCCKNFTISLQLNCNEIVQFLGANFLVSLKWPHKINLDTNSPCMDSFYTLGHQTFFHPFPPHLVHVVNERPLGFIYKFFPRLKNGDVIYGHPFGCRAMIMFMRRDFYRGHITDCRCCSRYFKRTGHIKIGTKSDMGCR